VSLAGLSPPLTLMITLMICALSVEASLIIKQNESFTLLERLLVVYGLFAMSLCSNLVISSPNVGIFPSISFFRNGNY
jgi:hypothetical protein